MSAYDIAELRAMIGERLQSIVKFWLSATMAVFAVGYYTASNLDGFSIGAIIAFHGIVTAQSVALSQVAFGQINALVLDAALLESEGKGAEITKTNMIQIAKPARVVTVGTFAVAFLVFAVYMMRMSA